MNKPSPKSRVTEKELKTRLQKDAIGLLRSTREQASHGIRAAWYDLYAVASHAISFYNKNPRQLDILRADKLFEHMHVKPEQACLLVMQYILGASDETSRQRANRAGRAIQDLLDRRVLPKHIARKLSEVGGVSGVLADKRAADKADESGTVDKAKEGAEGKTTRCSTITVTPWRPHFTVPRPPEGLEYVLVAVPAEQLENRLEAREHTLEYEVAYGPSGWAVARLINPDVVSED